MDNQMNAQNIQQKIKKFISQGKIKLSTLSANPNFLSRRERLPKNLNLVIIAGIFLLVAFFLGARISSGNSSGRISAPKALKTENINKTFEFPILDANGKKVSDISYVLQSAELQDSFIYQGKVATAVNGREFLLFNLKITNPYTKTISITTRDYIRVKMNGSNEQLAPEIHNDPVEIDAESTKYTRIGLPINTSDKDLIVSVGEIKGKKTEIKLNLSN